MPGPAVTDAKVALIARYRAAHYTVQWGGQQFTMQVDARSDALADCQRAHGVQCSAFVSAWNPRSAQQPAAANATAHERLLAMLKEEGHRWLPAWGQDPAGQWPAEQSLLVLGIAADAAIRLGRIFDQNAILLIGEDAVPRLVWVAVS